MPIEIKELHIKINVDEGGNSEQPIASSGKKEKSGLVEACVEQVMEIIAMRNER